MRHHAALGLEARHGRRLVLGPEAPLGAVHADGLGHGARRRLGVAGQDRRLDAGRGQRPHGGGRGRADAVGELDLARRRAVHADRHGGVAGLAVRRRPPDLHAPALDGRGDALADARLEAQRRAEREAARLGGAHERLSQRMLRELLGARREAEQLVGIPRGGRADRGELRAALGERARLVQRDEVDGGEPLQRVAAAEEHAALGRAAGADEHGGRGGEPERARAGDDEHRDGRHERVREAGAERQPDARRDHGDAEHDRHEDRRDAVGEALDGRAPPLRLAHEPDDARQGRVAADGRGAHRERAGAVDGRAGDGVARRLLDREGLAGQHRLVDGRAALLDLAVDGHALAGAHLEHVAHGDGLDGDVLRPARGHAARRLGRERHEPLDGFAGAAARARLQPAPAQDERHDHRRGLEVDRRRRSTGRDESRRHHGERAEAERRADAERDERVHVGRAVARRRPAGGEKAAPRPEHDRGREREHEPARARKVERAVRHRDPHDGQRQRRRDEGGAAELPELALTRRRGRLVVEPPEVRREARRGEPCAERGRRRGGRDEADARRALTRLYAHDAGDPGHGGGDAVERRARHGQRRRPDAVAGALDGRREARRVGRRAVVDDGRLARRGVDGRPADARRRREPALDAARAGGARHAGHGQRELGVGGGDGIGHRGSDAPAGAPSYGGGAGCVGR